MHVLVFPQINGIMKTQVLHRVNLTKHFYKTNRYEKYSVTVGATELWNKIEKQLKLMLFKDLSPNNTKTIAGNFYLFIYSLLIMQKIYMIYDFISS